MKLIFCPDCGDIRALYTVEIKIECGCGKSSGIVSQDGLHATISGNAVPLGIHNREFMQALRQRPASGMGKEFLAFVIPKQCHTVKDN